MKTTKLFLAGMILAGSVLSNSVVKAEVMVEPLDWASYCHLKFPPITEASLFTDDPVLNEAAGNVIDFYGSCAHDPLGKEEVAAQRAIYRSGTMGDSSND